MFLNKEQLAELTGYKRPNEQKKALSKMGIFFHVRPDGEPIVPLSALEPQNKGRVSKINWSAL